MKYIKKLNINFNDWEEIDDQKFKPYVDKYIYDIFIDFLKRNNVYKSFFNNIKDYNLVKNFKWFEIDSSDFFNTQNYNEWINSFDWFSSNEDEKKWAKLNNEWRNIVYTYERW